MHKTRRIEIRTRHWSFGTTSLLLPLLTFALTGCDRATAPDQLDADAAPLFDKGGVPANAVPYEGIGDCTQSVVVDPGTVTIENGIRMERGVVVDCPALGDVTGTVRVTRNSTLRNADGPVTTWEGPVWGTLVVTVDEYYGQAGFSGTFEGPFRTDWQNLLSGEIRANRRGTGDFQGLIMVVIGQSQGGIVMESGYIHGSSNRP